MTYNEQKFSEMVLYIAERLRDDHAGGATKLNKVLYFADFSHVRRTGEPISGAEYQKLEHGPAPRRLKPVRDALVRNGSAAMADEDRLGYKLARLVPLRSADISMFSAVEIATIDDVLRDLASLNARQVSDLSHEDAGWRLVGDGETIPYAAALVGAPQVSTPTSRRLERDAAERLGLIAQ